MGKVLRTCSHRGEEPLGSSVWSKPSCKITQHCGYKVPSGFGCAFPGCMDAEERWRNWELEPIVAGSDGNPGDGGAFERLMAV